MDGLGQISGKWAVIIGFDNKVMAGAWLAGQSENILRVTNLAKRLNIPLVWLVNCSGAKLTEQEKGGRLVGFKSCSSPSSPPLSSSCWSRHRHR